MAVSNAYKNQIQNRNFLSPVGFKFTLNRAPKVAFFGNSANIPGMTLGIANQPTYLKDIPTPGDRIEFDDFTIRFLVDENLENYMEIQNWIRGLGYPESLKEIYDLQNQKKYVDTKDSKLMNIYSDATLTVLSSNQNSNFKVMFSDMWPYSLSPLQFDATNSDIEYFTAEATFKYTIYNITDLSGNNL
jgi:hypothetical protein